MIVLREPFIDRYTIILENKLRKELKEKLPEKGFFAEMIEQANEIVKVITKE